MAPTRVAALDQLPETGSLPLQVEGHDLLLVRSRAGLFAIENMCSHAYSRLEAGAVRGVHIFCPLHGMRIDMRNGCPSGTLTDKPVKVWHVEVAGDDVLVDFARRMDAGG
jgi:3-phenylpropionate/trans-cinnamate dioxygenase ferredoxin subunit